MKHTVPNLRALRETVGMSQTTMANLLGVDARSVRRWESSENGWQAPEDAWQLLLRYRQLQADQVEAALDRADAIMDANHGEPFAAELPYYASDADFDAVHPGDGWGWQMANATARLMGDALMQMGWEVEFVAGGSGAPAMWAGELEDGE